GSASGGALGDSCTTTCSSGLSCYHAQGSVSLPNGYCTRDCVDDADCPSGGRCSQIDDQKICVTVCDASSASFCRFGYACCDDGHLTLGEGSCAPVPAKVCSGG